MDKDRIFIGLDSVNCSVCVCDSHNQVKAARESMNLMVEAWKEIPDPTAEVSSKGMIFDIT